MWAIGRRALSCERRVDTPKVVIAHNLLPALLAASSVIAGMATLQAAAACWERTWGWLSFTVFVSRCGQASIFNFVNYLDVRRSCGEPYLTKESTVFISLTCKEMCSANVTIWYQTWLRMTTDFTPTSGCFQTLFLLC